MGVILQDTIKKNFNYFEQNDYIKFLSEMFWEMMGGGGDHLPSDHFGLIKRH